MGLDEERGRETPSQQSDEAGMAGGEEPSLDADPETEPELKDYGPPADMPEEAEPQEVGEDEGAEEGISPWAPEGYSQDPEGPRPQPRTATRTRTEQVTQCYLLGSLAHKGA